MMNEAEYAPCVKGDCPPPSAGVWYFYLCNTDAKRKKNDIKQRDSSGPGSLCA
jgi:hypothetical protein